jgi:hypothetical protein
MPSEAKPEIIPSAFNPTGAPAVEKVSAEQTRILLVDRIRWLERLTTSEDFARYLAFVNLGIGIIEEKARDIDGRDVGTRDAYAQRLFGLRAMVDWPAKQLATDREALRALDEQANSRV